MNFNEKPQLLRDGYLKKNKELRYFKIFDNGQILYYKTHSTDIVRSQIQMQDVIEVLANETTQEMYGIDLRTENRTYNLLSFSLQDRAEWLAIFRSFFKKTNIHVYARFRPLLEFEIRRYSSYYQNQNRTMADLKYFIDDKTIRLDRDPETYEFDGVIAESDEKQVSPSKDTSRELFKQAVKQICTSVLEGYDGGVVVYGGKSSGKTFTMTAMAKLSIDYIREQLDTMKKQGLNYHTFDYSLTEIRNEKIYDMLNHFQDITMLGNDTEFCKSIDISNNNESFMEYICKQDHDEVCHKILRLSVILEFDREIQKSTLTFVDLGNGPDDTSLASLKRMINNMVQHHKRDITDNSTLSKSVSNIFGGNCRTTVILTMTPDVYERQTCVDSLYFGKQCKLIKNTWTKNCDITKEVYKRLKALKKENLTLKDDIASLKNENCKHNQLKDMFEQKNAENKKFNDECEIRYASEKRTEKQENENKNKEIENKNKEIENQIKEIEDKNKEIENKIKEIEDKNKEIEDLKNKMQKSREEINKNEEQFNMQWEVLNLQLTEQRNKYNNLLREKDEIQKRLDETHKHLTETEMIKENFEKKVSNMETQIKLLNEEKHKLAEENSKSNKECDTLKQRIQQNEINIQLLSNEKNEILASSKLMEVNNEQYKKLNDEYKALQSKYEKIQKEYQDVSIEVLQLQAFQKKFDKELTIRLRYQNTVSTISIKQSERISKLLDKISEKYEIKPEKIQLLKAHTNLILQTQAPQQPIALWNLNNNDELILSELKENIEFKGNSVPVDDMEDDNKLNELKKLKEISLCCTSPNCGRTLSLMAALQTLQCDYCEKKIAVNSHYFGCPNNHTPCMVCVECAIFNFGQSQNEVARKRNSIDGKKNSNPFEN